MLNDATIHVYLPAADLSRARKFYEMPRLNAKRGIRGGVFYECGGAVAFLYPTPNAGTSKASQAYWDVADVEAEVADLKARGVTFEEYDIPGMPMKDSIVTAGGAKTAWFKDTEGHPCREPATLAQSAGIRELHAGRTRQPIAPRQGEPNRGDTIRTDSQRKVEWHCSRREPPLNGWESGIRRSSAGSAAAECGQRRPKAGTIASPRRRSIACWPVTRPRHAGVRALRQTTSRWEG